MKTVVGAVLFLGALVLFNVALLKLLETGTCASGGPYVSARPCPDGTGAWVGALVGSIFGGLIGAAIFAFRGDRPGGSGDSLAGGFFGWGTFAWGLFFAGTGLVSLIGSLNLEDDGGGGKLGGLIVAGTFLVMGLPVFLISLKGIVSNIFGRGREQPRSMGEAANAAAAAANTPTPATTAGQWAKADQLRKSGALTQAEFDREKAKLLG